jgi:hypothetical protein
MNKWKYVYFVILTITCSDYWTLLLVYLKYLLNIKFEHVYIVFYSLNKIFWCDFYMWNDKPDGYPIPARNPTGTGTNFYLQVWVRVRISTRSLFTSERVITLPDLLPSLSVTRVRPHGILFWVQPRHPQHVDPACLDCWLAQRQWQRSILLGYLQDSNERSIFSNPSFSLGHIQ